MNTAPRGRGQSRDLTAVSVPDRPLRPPQPLTLAQSHRGFWWSEVTVWGLRSSQSLQSSRLPSPPAATGLPWLRSCQAPGPVQKWGSLDQAASDGERPSLQWLSHPNISPMLNPMDGSGGPPRSPPQAGPTKSQCTALYILTHGILPITCLSGIVLSILQM